MNVLTRSFSWPANHTPKQINSSHFTKKVACKSSGSMFFSFITNKLIILLEGGLVAPRLRLSDPKWASNILAIWKKKIDPFPLFSINKTLQKGFATAQP